MSIQPIIKLLNKLTLNWSVVENIQLICAYKQVNLLIANKLIELNCILANLQSFIILPFVLNYYSCINCKISVQWLIY